MFWDAEASSAIDYLGSGDVLVLSGVFIIVLNSTNLPLPPFTQVDVSWSIV